MAAFFKIVALCFVFNHHHLFGAGDFDNLGLYLRALDKRAAERGGFAVVGKEHLVEHDFVADIVGSIALLAVSAFNLFNLERQALLNEVLLTAGLDYCEVSHIFNKNGALGSLGRYYPKTPIRARKSP